MKYILGALCFIVGIILMFDLAKVQSTSALYGSIFLQLACLWVCKKEDKE